MTFVSILFVQLREAVKYSFFLDSYNASADSSQDISTDTGNVSIDVYIVHVPEKKILYSG